MSCRAVDNGEPMGYVGALSVPFFRGDGDMGRLNGLGVVVTGEKGG